MTKADFRLIERATIRVTKKGGRGVLVPGNQILTAAHCVYWDTSAAMAMGAVFIEDIESQGVTFKVAACCVEPVSDIAVLGVLEYQAFAEDVEKFEEFCERTKPVPICTREYPLRKGFPVFLYNKDGSWVKCIAKQLKPESSHFVVEATEEVKGGASGGPIVNESGELVGIVSHSNISQGPREKSVGRTPRPHMTLPPWIWREITREEPEMKEVIGRIVIPL